MRWAGRGAASAVLAAALAMMGAAAAAEPAAALWTGSLPRAAEPGEAIVLVSGLDGSRRATIRRRDSGADAVSDPLPIGEPLIAGAIPAAFGIEERCGVSRAGGSLSIVCAAGSHPAGMVAAFGRHVPRGAVLSLDIRSEGSGGFGLALVPEGREPDALVTAEVARTSLSLSPRDDAGPVQLVVTAPGGGGRLRIDDIRLEPPPRGDLPAAAWAWQPELWAAQPAALVADARRRGIARLFVSLPIAGGAVDRPDALRAFIRLAGAQHVAIEAVEGDPDMVSGEGLAAALARARAIAAFQASSPPGSRLAGVQYDIEPYIRPGWRDRDESYLEWADCIVALADAVGAPVDLVAPFWLAETARGRLTLDRAAPHVASVTAMAYRGSARAIGRVAEPLLAWGARRGKPVRIALESGAIEDEVETWFVPAARGTLALHPGDPHRLTLLGDEGEVPGARMFAVSASVRVRAASLSFLGDEAGMRRAARGLAPALAAWPTFAGYSFHGLSWLSAPSAR